MLPLIPDGLRRAFDAHRSSSVTDIPFPHSLMVESAGTPVPIEKQTWWRPFFTEFSVHDALRRRDASDVEQLIDPREGVLAATRCALAALGRSCRHTCIYDSFQRGPQPQRDFNVWMWRDFYVNPCGLPTLGCLCNVVRIKQVLFDRYGFFFDIRTIQEVYPDDEIATWVGAAFVKGVAARATFRDEELSYERLSAFFSPRNPTKMRSFEAEQRVQGRRLSFRDVAYLFEPQGDIFVPSVSIGVYTGEELSLWLVENDRSTAAARERYWKERRQPIRAQHDAQIVDRDEWRQLVRKRREENKVRSSR